jgi:F420-dependent methylenetetrahydromethanopterin dehydrogenase
LFDASPKAAALLGDRCDDADWFREALAECGVTACVLSRKKRKTIVLHHAAREHLRKAQELAAYRHALVSKPDHSIENACAS